MTSARLIWTAACCGLLLRCHRCLPAVARHCTLLAVRSRHCSLVVAPAVVVVVLLSSNQLSSPDAVVTISPLVPLSFVDCCFKRRTKPLLPTMVPSLSSRLPSLVGCFRCPPPPTLAASHGRRHQQSVALTAGASTSLSSSPGPLVIAVMPQAVPPPLRSRPNSLGVTRGSALRSSASWVRDNAQLPSLLPTPPLGTTPTFVCASSLSLSSL